MNCTLNIVGILLYDSRIDKWYIAEEFKKCNDYTKNKEFYKIANEID